jgi:hypothetical protein
VATTTVAALLVTEPVAFEDGKQYILCPTAPDSTLLFRKHGLPPPVPTTTTAAAVASSSSSAVATNGEDDVHGARMSIATTDHLDSLEELSYYFDDVDTLRHA